MDNAKLMQVKREVITTTATLGWRFITERASAVIRQMTEVGLDSDNKEESDRLISEARAARKFWRQFLQSVESSKNVDNADDWQDIAMD